MPRATWKGVLKIALVTIPIKVFPATESSEGLSFNQLHGDCQSRMQQKRWCPKCEIEVASKDIVKGFEFAAGKYVILLPEELDAVQPPSTKVIDVTQFADASELEPHSIDKSYYLAPDGPHTAEAFAVISAALFDKVGIGKVALYGREYLVAVRPALVPAPATYAHVLMLHTLHHAGEIRSADTIDDLHFVTPAPLDQVRLARQMVTALTRPLDLADFTDEYQKDMRRLIDAKIAGQEIVESIPVETAPVLSLKDALEQSLAAVKRPAKAALPTPKQKRA